jgi:hypothetical protein
MIYNIILILLVVPNIVRKHEIDFISPVITNYPLLMSGPKFEAFEFWKLFNLCFLTISLLLMFFYQLINKYIKIIEFKINYILITIIFSILLSAILSPFKHAALLGHYVHYEATLAYTCYLLVFFIVLNMYWDNKNQLKIIYSLVPFVVLNFIFGILAFFKYSVLDIDWVVSLISDSKFTEGSILWTTLANPNYISGASSFLFGLFFSLMIVHSDFKIKIISFISSVLTGILILTSMSKSGFVTFIVVFIVSLIVFAMKFFNKQNAILICLTITIMIPSFYVLASFNPWVWTESVGTFIPENPFEEKVESSSSPQVNDNAEEQKEKDKYLPDIPEQKFGPVTGRIYIWEMTLETWKERPIFGQGFDTLPYAFNQDDINKRANLNSSSIIVDKPHSLYLGWLYGGGIVTFLSIMTLLCYCFYYTVKKIFAKTDNVYIYTFGVGVIGYLVQGIVNDGVIGSSIMFWIFLGLLCVNVLNLNKQS